MSMVLSSHAIVYHMSASLFPCARFCSKSSGSSSLMPLLSCPLQVVARNAAQYASSLETERKVEGHENSPRQDFEKKN